MHQLNTYDLYTDNYPRLAKAYVLDRDAALKACSWGKFQILGENYRAMNFPSVHDYARAMGVSEKEHLSAFVKFVLADKTLTKALRDRTWASFARIYNGAQYKVNKYGEKMAEAYKKHTKK